MHHRSQLGKAAEEKVANYLKQNGFTILEYNYRKKYGEIDLIATSPQLLVFIEVKMRHHADFDISEVITRGKQRKIIAVAKEFISRTGWQECSYRFDVALLEGTKGLELTYIPNAFNEGGYSW